MYFKPHNCLCKTSSTDARKNMTLTNEQTSTAVASSNCRSEEISTEASKMSRTHRSDFLVQRNDVQDMQPSYLD